MSDASWNKSDLEEAVAGNKARKAALQHMEEVTLAYARWQGLTAEDGIDKQAAKAQMDRLLDDLNQTPEAWNELKELVDVIDDDVLTGLMQYSLKRSQDELTTMAREIEAMPEHDTPSPSPKKQRRKDRDR